MEVKIPIAKHKLLFNIMGKYQIINAIDLAESG
jgi:hypothetical protein